MGPADIWFTFMKTFISFSLEAALHSYMWNSSKERSMEILGFWILKNIDCSHLLLPLSATVKNDKAHYIFISRLELVTVFTMKPHKYVFNQCFTFVVLLVCFYYDCSFTVIGQLSFWRSFQNLSSTVWEIKIRKHTEESQQFYKPKSNQFLRTDFSKVTFRCSTPSSWNKLEEKLVLSLNTLVTLSSWRELIKC